MCYVDVFLHHKPTHNFRCTLSDPGFDFVLFCKYIFWCPGTALNESVQKVCLHRRETDIL